MDWRAFGVIADNSAIYGTLVRMLYVLPCYEDQTAVYNFIFFFINIHIKIDFLLTLLFIRIKPKCQVKHISLWEKRTLTPCPCVIITMLLAQRISLLSAFFFISQGLLLLFSSPSSSNKALIIYICKSPCALALLTL